MPIARLAEDSRLPAVYGLREHVEAGGFMFYGAKSRRLELSRRHLRGDFEGRQAEGSACGATNEVRAAGQYERRRRSELPRRRRSSAGADQVIQQRARPTRPTPTGGLRIRRVLHASYDPALHALWSWLDSWPGIGHVTVGMARQGYDLHLTRYDEKGWRATFYTTGMEHSPTSATGTG